MLESSCARFGLLDVGPARAGTIAAKGGEGPTRGTQAPSNVTSSLVENAH